MAEVFEDSYSAEALANMENYIISFGSLIKDVGSGEAFKNALFGMKVMIENKPRRVADLSKIYPGHRPMTLELLVFSREHIPLIVNEIKTHGFKKVTSDTTNQDWAKKDTYAYIITIFDEIDQKKNQVLFLMLWSYLTRQKL